LNETRFGPKKKSSPIYLGPKNLDTFWWNCQIIFRCASIHGRAVSTDGVNTFYKCIIEFQVNSFDCYWEILIIIWNRHGHECSRIWKLSVNFIKKCRDFLGRDILGTYHWNPEPVCNKSHFDNLFYLNWYFFNLLNLFWHTDKNFCFYAEVNFWDFAG
jgi:hypothetical protein